MRKEYNSVLSTPTEPNKIGRLRLFRYISKIEISADIGVADANIIGSSLEQNISKFQSRCYNCMSVHQGNTVMHDGSPCHKSKVVKNFLGEKIFDCWTGLEMARLKSH